MSTNSVQLKNSRILVVDDKKENLDLLTQILEQHDYEVAFALNGEKAIQVASLFLPELILLDVMMPGIDGFETCRRLKSLTELKDIPVIFVTACTHVNELVKAFSCGALDYVTKPIREAELLARVETHLKLRKLLLLRDQLIVQLREQNITLEAYTKEKEEQLAESEKLNHLGELVGELGHELATPLGVTRTALSGIQEKFQITETKLHDQSLSKPDLLACMDYSKEALTIMDANIQHANLLVQSFKSIVIGEFNDALTEVNMSQYLAEINTLLSPRLKNSPHKLIVECENTILFRGQIGALSQVLLNLINNALIHAFDKEQNGEIVIDVRLDNKRLIINIIDNGKGISSEIAEHIFDKYYTTRLGEGGSGLGLYIVKKLVEEKLNGEISLTSKAGMGSKFTLTCNPPDNLE